MVHCKKILMKRHFEGVPKLDDFELVEEELSEELKDGEFLVEGHFFSVDPYQRPYSRQLLSPGDVMLGSQVASVIKSKNGEYPIGTRLVGYWGARTHTIVDPKVKGGMMGSMAPLPDLGNLCPSYGLGAVGMPGNTAYFGFLEICQPKEGDVVVVSGAAGAVGSLVGQIAKIKGCTVIGFAGSDEKVDWLINELGFDQAFNYKTADWDKCLKEAAPKGIDCYFDNVGGKFSTVVRNHMKDHGRISVCGAISLYNDDPAAPSVAPCAEPTFIFKQLKMEGFLVSRWMDRWLEGLSQMMKWIQEGKIKVRETVTEGFENIPKAFINMLQGGNFGKAIVKA